MSTKTYTVHIRTYALGHFIKSFEKKYHNKPWNETLESIKSILKYVHNIIGKRNLVEIISSHPSGKKHILKCEFAIAGTHLSPHASGNRYIVFMDDELAECHILLLYGKDDYGHTNETNWWKQQVKENHADIKELFKSL